MRYTGINIKFAALLILLLASLFMLNAVDRESMEEYKAKSIFLYRLCKFTRWPVPLDVSRPFIISVIGKLPPGTNINIPSMTIGKQKVVVRTIKRLDEIDNSNLLFVASSESQRIGVIMDYVRDKPILTVGDTKGYVQQGVMLNFYINKKGRLDFQINDDSIKNAKFEVPGPLYMAGDVFQGGKFTSKKK